LRGDGVVSVISWRMRGECRKAHMLRGNTDAWWVEGFVPVLWGEAKRLYK
jgi:hypothetical protein